MGKSNRIRNNRANEALASVNTPKKKKGMPSWALNVITIVIAAIILFSVAFGLMTANGVFGRMTTVVKSENFRVNENMMRYFFQTTYQNYVSDNSSYLQYMGLDTGKSLKEQSYSTGDNGKTWYDVMMDRTKTSVEELLVWCEEAEQRGITLTSEEKKEINTQVDSINNYALNLGYSLSALYGEGINKQDIRKCMRLSALAAKCMEEVSDEIEVKIDDDAIEAELAANLEEYEFVDMLTYTFNISFSDVADEADENASEESIIATYVEKINAAKAKAEALSQAPDEDTFKDLVAGYEINDIYEDALADAKKETDLTGDQLEKYNANAKVSIVAYVLKCIQENAVYDENKAVEAVGGELDDTEKEFIKELAVAVYDDTVSAVDGTVTEGYTNSDGDELLSWAFEQSAEAVYSTKIIESGDGKNGEALPEGADNLDFFQTEVGMLTKSKYMDETNTKNIGIMVFDSEDTATEAIARLTAGMTYEAFAAVADELGGNVSKYENYTKGSLGVTAVDTWLYGDAKVGSFKETPVSVDSETYIVALYYGDGEIQWKVNAKNAVFTDRFEEVSAAVTAAHRPNFKFYGENEIFNAKAIANIDG